MAEDPYQLARRRMVSEQLEGRGVGDRSVLRAFARVPRHLFVPPEQRGSAYEDHPLPIGSGQTISQPYVVAYMLERLRLEAAHRVLEIGTGSGYQTALLAELVDAVYTVEFHPELAARALRVLDGLGYGNVEGRVGDGATGWPEASPFDAIVGSASPLDVPRPLMDQLAEGGRLIMPVGGFSQHLVLITRSADGALERRPLLAVRFVPMLTARE